VSDAIKEINAEMFIKGTGKCPVRKQSNTDKIQNDMAASATIFIIVAIAFRHMKKTNSFSAVQLFLLNL
jgi:hypothetical protein